MKVPDTPALSVVIPVHNEAQSVTPLHGELRAVLDRLGEPFEILFVNDGSEDGTLAALQALRRRDPSVRILDLDGNFGEAAALSAGFHAARGEVVVTLDGDGQNDPADIPRLLEVLRTRGVRVVSGRREERQEGFWLRVWPSRIANALIARVTGIPVHDCGCGLKAYRRGVVSSIHLPRGMNRFLPAILGVRPAEVAEVPARDRCRRHGASHYGLARTLAVLRDLPVLPLLIRDPRRAETAFALGTAGAAAAGALLLRVGWAATLACDLVAALGAVAWWNARRFNRAQAAGVYRLREESA